MERAWREGGESVESFGRALEELCKGFARALQEPCNSCAIAV
jgi:hypothetical protein